MNVMNNIKDLNYFGRVITRANLVFVGVTILLQAPKELLSTSNLTQLTNFRVVFLGVIIGTTFNQESEEGTTLKFQMMGIYFL